MEPLAEAFDMHLDDDVDSAERPVRNRVLIVDDDRDVRDTLTEALQSGRFDVVAAESGAAALRVLRHDPRIGLILLDLMMPEMDGWRFRHAQRTDPQLADIPTIIVTGAPLSRIVHQELQAADYLLKPVGRDHLLSVVGSYCSRSDSDA